MKIKKPENTNSLLTALLIGVVSGGIVATFLTRRKYTQFVSKSDDLIEDLKEKTRQMEISINNKYEKRKDVLKDKEIMEKIVDDIKEKINS